MIVFQRLQSLLFFIFHIKVPLFLSELTVKVLLSIIPLVLTVSVASFELIDEFILVIVILQLLKLMLIARPWEVETLAVVVATELIKAVNIEVVTIWVVESYKLGLGFFLENLREE